MADTNLCVHCNLFWPLDVATCEQCRQPLLLDARGAISIWRYGEIRDGVLGPLMAGLRERLGGEVVLQPAFLRENEARRDEWKGISATVVLNKLLERTEEPRRAWLSLCVTEENIVSAADENWLFGLAYLKRSVGVMSFRPLRDDGASDRVVSGRALKIAIHELGHALGRDDEPYDGPACVMKAEIERDCLELLDRGTVDFCDRCRRALRMGAA